MSSRTGSNGCQPPQPAQPASNHESDVTNTENVEKQKDYCRDFIWGVCNKGTQCKYCHELDFEVMKKTLKFCHDFQNSTGCTREHCTYLHATKEEQTLFKATGQLPQVLAQRHASMSAAAAETIPQIALYIQESLASAPPPPPPPLPPVSVPVSVAPVPAPATVYPRPPVVSVASVASMAQRPAIMPIQQPPPPPPPPTVPNTSVRQRAPVFTAPPPTATFAMAQPPPVLPFYDASRPPPPIMPTHLKSEPMKRQASNDDVKSRPSKLRKGEEVKSADALCEQCVQRELRIEALRKQLDAINEEEEYETLMYKKKFDEYQNLKEILKSLISTDLFQKFFEENVEGIPQNQFHNIFEQATFSSGVSRVPNQFLLQLIEYVMTDARNVDLAPSPSLRIDESLVQALSALPRKTNPVKIIYNNNNTNHHNTNAPPEVLQTLMEILRQYNSSDKSPPSEPNHDSNKSPGISNNTNNGSYQYPNRQQDIPATANTNRFPPPPAHGAMTSPVYAPPTAHATAPYAQNIAPAPPPYQPYQPMPPAGLYYPPPFAGPPTGMQMAPDNQTMRTHAPVSMAPAPPPPAPLAPVAPPAPPPIHQPGQYAIGRYPPPYYPRHQ